MAFRTMQAGLMNCLVNYKDPPESPTKRERREEASEATMTQQKQGNTSTKKSSDLEKIWLLRLSGHRRNVLGELISHILAGQWPDDHL
jgi:hypothetical protein